MVAKVAKAQPATPSELGWPHPIPQLGNTNPLPPCIAFANPMTLNVLTNSVTPIQLAGGNGTFIIEISPTNGTLTGFNSVSGAVTYTETAANKTTDFFAYCVSNSVTCMNCAGVNVNIFTPVTLTCSDCFNTPAFGGGVVTGNIYFNTGVPYEQICVSYTNASCQLATNCATTDGSGNVSFFLHFCPGSSNACIVSLQTNCNTICYFNHVNVSGAFEGNGDYYFNNFALVNFMAGELQITYTNSSSNYRFDYDTIGALNNPSPPLGCGSTFITNYAAILTPAGYPIYWATNAASNVCISQSGTITGWYCGNNPQPSTVTWDTPESTNSCIQVCP